MIDMEALVSIKSYYNGFWWCKCCKNPIVPLILITLLNFKFSSFFLLTSFTMLSKCFNSLRTEIIIYIGDNEILPLMKCVKFFYLEEPSFVSSIGSNSIALSFVHLFQYLHFHMQSPPWHLSSKKMSCLVPHSLFNCSKIAASSSTRIISNYWLGSWHPSLSSNTYLWYDPFLSNIHIECYSFLSYEGDHIYHIWFVNL